MRHGLRSLAAGLLLLATGPAPAQETAGPMDFFIAFSRSQLAGSGFKRHQAEIGGEPLTWWSKGEGAPALVLVHGVSDQAGTWFQVAPKLADSRRVLLVDLPGHGESAPAAGPLLMSLVVERFEKWLESEVVRPGEAPPILVGNSMGAWVSMLAAHRHPDRVSRVVAVNGGPLRADTGDLDLLPESRDEASRLMAALRDPQSPPTPAVVLDDLVRRAAHGQVARMFEAREDLESHLMDDRLEQITTPVDVLWGESDRYLGRDYPERLLAGLPNARLSLISACGHLPQAECPAHFTERLVAVLAQEPPRRSAAAGRRE